MQSLHGTEVFHDKWKPPASSSAILSLLVTSACDEYLGRRSRFTQVEDCKRVSSGSARVKIACMAHEENKQVHSLKAIDSHRH
jgi:hypothetical protein